MLVQIRFVLNSISVLGLVLLLTGAEAQAGRDNATGSRKTACYRISEKQEELAKSAYLMCIASNDLQRYPKSVVTFSVLQRIEPEQKVDEANRVIASTASTMVPREKLLVRRHYSAFDTEQFGRRGMRNKPSVLFDRKNAKVYLGFMGDIGKEYYFSPTPEGPSIEVGQH